MYQEILKILNKLESVPSVTGFEQAFLNHLSNMLEAINVPVTFKEGAVVAGFDSKLVVSMHIDRHGLVAKDGEVYHAATFLKREKGSPNYVKRVLESISRRHLKDQVSLYDQETGEVIWTSSVRNAWVEEGMACFNLMKQMPTRSRVPLAFTQVTKLDEGHFVGQIDNLISAAIVLYLFQQGWKGQVIFTTGEEMGFSHESLSAWLTASNKGMDTKFLVLDTTPFASQEDAKVDLVLRHQDERADFDADLTANLEDQVKSMGYQYLFKCEFLQERDEKVGKTELGQFVKQLCVTGTTLQIPSTGYHTTHESCSVQSVEAVVKVLKQLY